MSKMFYLWSKEHQEWWRPSNNGYTTEILIAGKYTQREADCVCGIGQGVAIPCDAIQAERDTPTEQELCERAMQAERRKLWKETYLGALTSGRSFKNSFIGVADYALEEFDKRFGGADA